MSTVPDLWLKHRGLADAISSAYWVPGLDRDDMQQEARIALWLASRTHDPERAPFPLHAAVQIRSRLYGLITASRRHKRMWLGERVPLDGVEDPRDFMETSEVVDELRHLLDSLPLLTPLERRALRTVVNGDHQTKTVSNALVRARRKLRGAA